jgi:hypothetical protein
MKTEVAVTHALEVKRCYQCGRYWAREETAPGQGGCPGCLEETRRRHIEEIELLKRRLVSQRGATTRAGKR